MVPCASVSRTASQGRGGLVGLRLLVDRETQDQEAAAAPLPHRECASPRSSALAGRRSDGEARERRRAHDACQNWGWYRLISQVSSLSLSAASAALARKRIARDTGPAAAPHPEQDRNVSAVAQTSGSRHTRRPFEVPSGRLGEHDVKAAPHIRCSINSALTPICTSSFTARMERGEAAERRRQRSAGDLLDHRQRRTVPDKPRRRQTMTGRFPQVATGDARRQAASRHRRSVRHCALVRRNKGRSVSSSSRLICLTLTRRLGQVEPLRGAMETAANRPRQQRRATARKI